MDYRPQIAVDQIGYLPRAQKHFMIPHVSIPFSIVDQDGMIVFCGVTSQPKYDDASQQEVSTGSFSDLTAPGTYVIEVDGFGKSYPFTIERNIYNDALKALTKAFYYQRCGMELTEQFAGPFAHKACHVSPAIEYDGKEKKTSIGGWHDAGDYGKYTVAAAKAIADLLLAYEFFPQQFVEPLDIPESSSLLPDILEEVKYELSWLFTMQRPDGAVYHKVTTKHFPPLTTMPEDDLNELVFSPISFTATATFVAVMAMAARVYLPFDEQFSALCLNNAKQSYAWIRHTEDRRGFVNPLDILTGEYGNHSVLDEEFWANAEMFRSTGEKIYHERFLNQWQSGGFSLLDLGWADVGGYGTMAYLLCNPSTVDKDVHRMLYDAWLKRAEELAVRTNSDGYRTSLLVTDYIWGSLMVLLNSAMHLIIADHLEEGRRFQEAALDHLHYIFGCNPLGQCYVTGLGANPVMHPHHRPTVGDTEINPVPGLLSGGPNRFLQDDAAKKRLVDQPPAKCYIDDQESYSTNEITIYWNSPAVFLAAFACDKASQQ